MCASQIHAKTMALVRGWLKVIPVTVLQLWDLKAYLVRMVCIF